MSMTYPEAQGIVAYEIGAEHKLWKNVYECILAATITSHGNLGLSSPTCEQDYLACSLWLFQGLNEIPCLDNMHPI